MSGVAGPWAFIFFHRASRSLYFGRDRLGRRSLCFLEDPRWVMMPLVVSASGRRSRSNRRPNTYDTTAADGSSWPPPQQLSRHQQSPSACIRPCGGK